MPLSTTTPNILQDPGFLFYAPTGTTFPTNTVTGSKFTDAWPVGWVQIGATEDGSEFQYETNVEAVKVAEFFDPIKYNTTERSGSFAFNMADWKLSLVKLALNGGTLTVVSGTGATTLSSYTPPAPGSEARTMLGWESLDSTVRIVVEQAINSGSISMAFKKAPAMAVIPCNFNFEIPTSTFPFKFFTAGASRGA